MTAKRASSPKEPGDGDAKRRKLGHATDQDLEDNWQLLDAVRPIFSSKLLAEELPWTSSNLGERDVVSQRQIEMLVRDFTIEMTSAMSSGPPHGLKEDQEEYRQKLEDLLDILHSLVKEVILEASMAPILAEIGEGDEDVVRSLLADRIETSHLDWKDKAALDNVSERSLDHDRGNISYSSNQASNRSKTPSPSTPPDGSYPRLQRLARLMEGCTDQGNHFFHFIETEHEYQHFVKLVDNATELNNFLNSSIEEDLGECRSSPSTEPRIFPTRWKDYGASKASGVLYYALSKRLKDCTHGRQQHQVKLQLNGFEFDHWDSSSSLNVRILVFTSLLEEKWTQHRCAQLDRAPKLTTGLKFITRTCTSLLKVAMNREALKIFFFNSSLYKMQDQLSRDNSLPTVKLSDLLDQKYFQSIEQEGAVTLEDKAVLALSLGRSLLHLFGTPWAQKWSTEDVHFLHRGHAGSGCEEILNIHYPYLICPLTIGAEDCDLVRSHHTLLLSFARLLLEIETGSRIVEGNQLEQSLLDILEPIEFKWARESYGAAVRGCLTFKALFARELAVAKGQTERDDLTLARKCLYDHIVKNLERNFDLIPSSRQSEFLQPRNLHVAKRQTGSTPFPGAEPAYVERTLLLRDNVFFDAYTTGKDGNVTAAEKFFNLFELFREDYIMPILEREGSPHERVKVAILDTGIDVHDPHIRGLLSQMQRQGHTRRSRKSITVKDCTKAGSRDGMDTCGHGTHMAYLLMKLAPEADLYIYKVSEGMRDNNPEDIATAIYDAVDIGVDIISMSFGFKKISPTVEEAIDHACKTGKKGDKEIILFAAASNNGFTAPRTFPATHHRVIGVHALDGLGYASSSINTPGGGRNDNLGTLGLGIRLHWKTKWDYKSGTSYATPIAAGIAVNILEWLNSVHGKGMLKSRHFHHLRRPDTIREIMGKRLAPTPNNVGDVLFVAPWHLWKELDDDKTWEEAANDVCGMLRVDFCQQIPP